MLKNALFPLKIKGGTSVEQISGKKVGQCSPIWSPLLIFASLNKFDSVRNSNTRTPASRTLENATFLCQVAVRRYNVL